MLANGVKKSVRCGFSRIVDFFCVGQKTAELQTTADQLLEGQTDIKALVEKLSEQQQATESKLLGQITGTESSILGALVVTESTMINALKGLGIEQNAATDEQTAALAKEMKALMSGQATTMSGRFDDVIAGQAAAQKERQEEAAAQRKRDEELRAELINREKLEARVESLLEAAARNEKERRLSSQAKTEKIAEIAKAKSTALAKLAAAKADADARVREAEREAEAKLEKERAMRRKVQKRAKAYKDLLDMEYSKDEEKEDEGTATKGS